MPLYDNHLFQSRERTLNPFLTFSQVEHGIIAKHLTTSKLYLEGTFRCISRPSFLNSPLTDCVPGISLASSCKWIITHTHFIVSQMPNGLRSEILNAKNTGGKQSISCMCIAGAYSYMNLIAFIQIAVHSWVPLVLHEFAFCYIM